MTAPRETMRVDLYAMRWTDWLLAFTAGALIWTPGLLAIVGWASHWNAYTNLILTLMFPVYISVAWTAWRHGRTST